MVESVAVLLFIIARLMRKGWRIDAIIHKLREWGDGEKR
jgi:hypothetical protein